MWYDGRRPGTPHGFSPNESLFVQVPNQRLFVDVQGLRTAKHSTEGPSRIHECEHETACICAFWQLDICQHPYFLSLGWQWRHSEHALFPRLFSSQHSLDHVSIPKISRLLSVCSYYTCSFVQVWHVWRNMEGCSIDGDGIKE
jgi:hypothetical protein